MSKLLCLLPLQALIKQDNLDAFNEKDPYKPDDSRDEDDDNDDNDNSMETETFPLERDEVMPLPIPHLPAERMSFPKGLPWAPKVRYSSLRLENQPESTFYLFWHLVFVKLLCLMFHREKDIENFLESSRSKFIGYTLGK